MNEMTIQEAGYMILQKYYCDFPLNNPAAFVLGNVQSKKRSLKEGLNDSTTAVNTKANATSGMKIYNLDGTIGLQETKIDMPDNGNHGGHGNVMDKSIIEQSKKVLASANARSKKRKEQEQSANDKYYDELEWERHCRKRKARLELATEKAFERLQRFEGLVNIPSHSSKHGKRKGQDYSRSNNIMDAQEAATVLFPSLARPLQKYLRTTRQHLHYSLANTTSHLSECFEHGLSHRAFLQRYLRPRPSLSYLGGFGTQFSVLYVHFEHTSFL